MRVTDAMFEPGRNCWRIERADRAAVIVDACDYYRIIREAMTQAKHRILLIGWDFDPRIALDRTSPEHKGETLGSFLLDLAKAKPQVAIDILVWDVGAFKMLGRGSAMLWLARWAITKAITFQFDRMHPTGCSHHQKIVVIDGVFAVCGGIDMTRDRWDTSAHRDDDPDRVRPDGTPYGPWHDITMAVDGDAARALAELAGTRWQRATGRQLPALTERRELWPQGLEPTFTDTDFAISRTRGAHRDVDEVREIETLFLDMIATAKHFIYAENQYFTSPKLAAAIAARMEEDNPPEIVLVTPLQADGWLEQKAMDATRIRLARTIGHVDKQNRFRIYTPFTAGGAPIYVHAKLMIVDDRLLRIGSSNMNNRSLGLDSECDLACEAGDDAARGAQITALRSRLLAEHLGCEQQLVAATFAATGSLIATIEALRGAGKTLRLLELPVPEGIEKFIADTELLDPVSPTAMFENIGKPSLMKRFGHSLWRQRRHSGRKSGTER